MIYKNPNDAGSPVSFKGRYENFIGGEWVAPAKGQYFAVQFKGFKCFSSGHPIPNTNGLKAAKFIKNTLKNLDKDDLVLMLISGGGSALLPFPVNEISLKDKILTNKLLLSSGANIKEINSVRKHLSQVKGGNLVKICYPAKIHGLILSDVIGDDLGSISSGMTTFDETNFSDVLSILKKYKLWRKIPIKVKNFISKGLNDINLETPKKNNKIFKETTNTLIGSNRMCLKNINSPKHPQTRPILPHSTAS